jgi:hypothetical protein
MAALTAALLVGIAAIVVGLSGSGSGKGAVPERLRADRFDAGRAMADVRAQLRFGPRPAGSAADRRLARWLRARLPQGRLEPVGGGLANVVGVLPGRRPAIAVAAHFDTKDLPGFLGANDGAAGTAAVLEIARALGRPGPGGREVRFLLFDGEESPRGTPDTRFLQTGVRGSRAYARAHARELGALVLLDFIALRDERIPREAGSDPRLWARLRAAARSVGAQSIFPLGTAPPIEDDHTPFARAGVPAVDLIDFDYPCFHRTCDDLQHVSPASLDAVGETVVTLARTGYP